MSPWKKTGFTMVELLIVIGMLLVLAGSVTSAVGSANRRAKIQQATAEVHEMTKAILAYENFGRVNEKSPLSNHTMKWEEAVESKMAFILGREAMKNGQKGNIPVLFNAEIKNGAIRDPWGHPYRVYIQEVEIDPDETSDDSGVKSFVAFPNFNRPPAEKLTSAGAKK